MCFLNFSSWNLLRHWCHIFQCRLHVVVSSEFLLSSAGTLHTLPQAKLYPSGSELGRQSQGRCCRYGQVSEGGTAGVIWIKRFPVSASRWMVEGAMDIRLLSACSSLVAHFNFNGFPLSSRNEFSYILAWHKDLINQDNIAIDGSRRDKYPLTLFQETFWFTKWE
jgi:hypothetical protein